MKRRLHDAAADEQGVVLMLTLGFVVFIGVIVVALASYAVTNLHNTETMRDLRAVQLSGSSAAEAAINTVRFDSTKSNVNICSTTAINGYNLTVDCQVLTVVPPLAANKERVQFDVKLAGTSHVVTTAIATFDRSDVFNVLVSTDSWSVKK